MSLSVFSDEYFMKQALSEAYKAFDEDEVPVGAIIVVQNTIVARAYNQTEKLKDVSAHAEILAYTAATQYLDSKYLLDCTLYVTLEPCIMCAGMLKWSQIKRIVYGATDLKNGFQEINKNILHPKTELKGGVLETECAKILTDFFKQKRL